MRDEDMPRETFYVTKYALSTGIQVRQGFVHPDIGDGKMLCADKIEGESCDSTFHGGDGGDWHSTRENALVKADAMRIKKIASLRRQIAKLEKMRFE
jgi:hypothetical protein